jgi:hypothetical protein
MFPAQMLFDPHMPDTAWIAQGVGVCKATGFAGSYRLTDWSAGMETLVASSGLSVPGGRTFLVCWDKPFWRFDENTRYANSFRYPRAPYQPHSMDVVAQGTYLDYAGNDGNFLVGVVSPTQQCWPGYSSDGGDNWYGFEGTPPKGWGYGGCIAASTKTNFVLLPSNNGFGAYTLDGGRSWDTIKLDGVHETDSFANASYVMRKNVAADKTRPGVFALVYTVMTANSYDNPVGGLWLTHDGGKSWTQQLTGIIDDFDHKPQPSRPAQDQRQFWQCQLAYVPGFSRELIYTPHADAPDDRLWWSKDDGTTWSEMHSSIRNVISFGFGKSAPGQSRPVFYFWGEVKGVLGLYASLDWLTTPPVLLTRFPSQALPHVVWVEGDLNRFGRAYVGTNGAGWVSVEFGV